MRLRGSIEERFWARVHTPAVGCWEWKGPTNAKGYGIIGRGGRGGGCCLVHRLVFIWLHGPTADCVLHRCDNPACVRPSHLFAGTSADNMRDMVAKGRQSRGADRPNAKLNPGDVRQIRWLVANGRTQRSVARSFGVHNVTVHGIVHGSRWGWLE